MEAATIPVQDMTCMLKPSQKPSLQSCPVVLSSGHDTSARHDLHVACCSPMIPLGKSQCARHANVLCSSLTCFVGPSYRSLVCSSHLPIPFLPMALPSPPPLPAGCLLVAASHTGRHLEAVEGLLRVLRHPGGAHEPGRLQVGTWGVVGGAFIETPSLSVLSSSPVMYPPCGAGTTTSHTLMASKRGVPTVTWSKTGRSNTSFRCSPFCRARPRPGPPINAAMLFDFSRSCWATQGRMCACDVCGCA